VCHEFVSPDKLLWGKSGEDGVFRDCRAALAMWAILKMHDVMADCLAHNFEDHPSIAAKSIHFLMYNFMGARESGTEGEVKALDKQLDKFEMAYKNLTKQVNKRRAQLTSWKKGNKDWLWG
jgi:hypothetical protein